jgi:putative transferase (TIGR04331 family)
MFLKKQFFLVTTALSDFWDTSKKLVLLDNYCKNKNNKKILNDCDFETLSGLGHTRSSYIEGRKYCDNNFNSILIILSNWLNNIHNINKSDRYWRIIIGPFLMWYVEAVFVKYRAVKSAVDSFPDISTYGLDSNSFYTPKDTNDFRKLSTTSDLWNLQLTTQVIDIAHPNLIKKKKIYTKADSKSGEVSSTFNFNQRNLIKKYLFYYFYRFNINSEVLFSLPTMNLIDRMKLILKTDFKFWPYFRNRDDCTDYYSINYDMRKSLKEIKSNNEFENIIIKSLFINFPTIFIENYHKLEKNVNRKFKNKPKLLFIDLGLYYDEELKMGIAKYVENGIKLVILQHGGSYGDSLFHPSENHEKMVSDYFFSWGWSDSKQVIPVPSQRIHKLKSFRKNSGHILYPTAWRVKYRGLSLVENLKYWDDHNEFMTHLNDDILSKLLLRLYFRENNEDSLKQQYNKKFPSMKVEYAGESKSFNSRLRNSRFFIADNINTTVLQAMSLNIPTIIFVSNLNCRASSQIFYNRLKKVGIFHSSPKSAAMHLNKTINSVSDWWYSADVQEAKNQYCEQYALSDKNYLNRYIKEINMINNK